MLQLSPGGGFIQIVSTTSDFELRPGRKLPRLRKLGAAYAVTFRLADSLPTAVTSSWRREREEICSRAQQLGRDLTESEHARLARLFSSKVDAYLAAGHGECLLSDRSIAEIVERALLHFDGSRYLALHWCLMPNHVHAILWPMPGFDLDDILHAMKSFTAHESNRFLGRRGEFWLEESYDHLIRNNHDLWHAAQYITANPLKAGLNDWPWMGKRLVADGDGVRVDQLWHDQYQSCVVKWEEYFADQQRS